MIICWVLIVLAAGLVAHQILDDRGAYPRFKALTDTAARQAMYRRWTIESFAKYGVVGVVGLLLLGRPDALYALPPDVAAARDALFAANGLTLGADGVGPFAALAMGVGIIVGGVAPLFIKSKRGAAPVVGDIETLLPRNRAEMAWGIALSVNAGVAEEIFFRAMLPLAIYAVSGSVELAFGAAAVLFGVVHAYQGVIGIIATFAIGVIMTFVYLSTGQLWIPILLHALMDLRAMVLTPLAMGRLKR